MPNLSRLEKKPKEEVEVSKPKKKNVKDKIL